MDKLGMEFRTLIDILEKPVVEHYERCIHLFQVGLLKRDFKSFLKTGSPSALVVWDRVSRLFPNLSNDQREQARQTRDALQHWCNQINESERRDCYRTLFENTGEEGAPPQSLSEQQQDPPTEEYEDFILKIAETKDHEMFTIFLLGSPAGGCEERFCLPSKGDPFWRFMDDLRICFGSPPPSNVLGEELGNDDRHRYIGRTLFDMLFRGQILAAYHQSIGRIGERKGLCIRLHFAPSNPELAFFANFPWELLYDPSKVDYFCLNRKHLVIRCLDTLTESATLEWGGQLRVLVVTSSPIGLPQLDWEKECKALEASQSDKLAIQFLESPDLEKLRCRLRQDKFNVLHFIGHGGYDPNRKIGGICLLNGAGGPEFVSGRELSLCATGFMPQLFVLNSCQDMKTDEPMMGNINANIATRIVTDSGAAVISMQSPISDDVAIQFSRKLYTELGAGQALEIALTEARLSMCLGCRGSYEWALPMLFQWSPLPSSDSSRESKKLAALEAQIRQLEEQLKNKH